jgi:ABC-type protease/lipase transport system fused ATPase/permease subunit
VILDEPNSNLDDQGEKALTQTLKGMKEQGITTIVVSHKPSLLANVDKIMMLNNGQVALYGPREEVMKKMMGAVQQARQASQGPQNVPGMVTVKA